MASFHITFHQKSTLHPTSDRFLLRMGFDRLESMNSPSSTASSDVLTEALGEAFADFLDSVDFEISRLSSQEFGVFFSKGMSRSTLIIPEHPPLFVRQLAEKGIPQKDAWYLALAHEFGHLILNAECIKQNMNPADPNAQLAAMKLHLTIAEKISTPSFHKESAIEAYCDACLAKIASRKFGSSWPDVLAIVARIRENDSSRFKGKPGDEYITHPILRLMLDQRTIINPSEAALFAFRQSKAKSTLILDIGFSLIELSSSLADSLPEKLKIRRLGGRPPPPGHSI